MIHLYGLTGLGLLAWFFAGLWRRGTQLGFGRPGGAALAWRLVPVAALLLAVMALLSGEPARFHSWWGCVLLGGFVQGVHERVFSARIAKGPPRWVEGLLRRIGRGARIGLQIARGVSAVGSGLARAIRALAGGRRSALRRPAPRTPFRGSRR